MTDENAGDAKVRSSELAREVSTDMQLEVSEADFATIVDAFEQDLITQCHQAKDDEERLERVETQTQVLAEAVVATTKIEETLAPAGGRSFRPQPLPAHRSSKS